MPQAPTDPLIGSFLRRKRNWSDAYTNNAVASLNRWHRWLHTHGVTDLCAATGDLCADYLTERADTVVGSTVHKDWQFLVWFYTWLRREGELPTITRRGVDVEQIGRGPMEDIDAPRINDPDPDRVRHVSDADYRRLMATFDKRKVIDCRNAAMCSLMYWSGVRMSEVARAELARYDATEGCVAILGKNNKWRTVTLLEETREWVDRYLRRRAGDNATALFAATYGAADKIGGHMRADAIGSMLERRCNRVGIDVTGHQFRRAFTIEAKRRGVPETEIARQAGWAPSSAKLMLPRYTKSDADRLTHEAFRANDPTAAPTRRRLRVV
jgi:site-specific recombinase XerD